MLLIFNAFEGSKTTTSNSTYIMNTNLFANITNNNLSLTKLLLIIIYSYFIN